MEFLIISSIISLIFTTITHYITKNIINKQISKDLELYKQLLKIELCKSQYLLELRLKMIVRFQLRFNEFSDSLLCYTSFFGKKDQKEYEKVAKSFIRLRDYFRLVRVVLPNDIEVEIEQLLSDGIGIPMQFKANMEHQQGTDWEKFEKEVRLKYIPKTQQLRVKLKNLIGVEK